MIKKYCDICNLEMTVGTINKFGTIARYSKIYHLSSKFSFNKQQTPSEPSVKEESMDLCEKCIDNVINKYLVELKKSLKND